MEDSSSTGADSIRIINNMLYIKPKSGTENHYDLLNFLGGYDLEIKAGVSESLR